MALDATENVHAGAVGDHLQISPLGKLLDGIGDIAEIRYERVNAIREQITLGAYESTEKLERAVDRLLGELTGW
jgi:hypothetical protein